MPKLASNRRNFNWFLGIKGVAQNTSEFFVTDKQADSIVNLHADKYGQWSAYNQGFTRFTAQLESGVPIQSLFTFTTAAATKHMVALVNGKLKDINLSTGVVVGDIKTGLGTTTKADAEAFSGNLFIVEESMAPQKWAGSGASSNATGWPVTLSADTYNNPKIIEKYNSRLAFANFQAGAKFPSHLILSDILAPESFDVSGVADNDGIVVQVAPGDGQSIQGMKSLYLPAQNEEVLLVGKDRSLYAISGYKKGDIKVNLVNASTGVLNSQCMVQVGNDVLYMDETNIYSMSTALESGTLQPKAIASDNVKATLSQLNLSAKEYAWAIHHPTRKEVWFAIPTGSLTYPDKVLVYRYDNDPQQPIQMWSIRDYHKPTSGSIIDNVFYGGDDSGYINKWFVSSQYHTTGINWKYEWPWNNFTSQGQLKKVLELFVWFLIRADETITVETEWRGGGNETSKNFSLPLSVSSSGGIYGSSAPPAGVYGTAVYGSGYVLRQLRIPVYGQGLQFKLTVSSTTGSNGPILLGANGIVEYRNFNRRYV